MRTPLRLAAAFTALLCASAFPLRAQEVAPPKPAAPAAIPTLVAPAAFREVTDAVGRHVRVPAEIKRIVSLAPNLTETIFALGAGDRLVGVTDFCDYPPEALTKQKVGGPMNPSFEQIAALKPDVILAQANAGNRRETVDALERLGLPVYATDAHNLAQILDSFRDVAALIGVPEQGEKLAADLRARLENLKRRIEGRAVRRAFFVVWHEPLITIGKNTFLADALRWAGAEPAVALEQDWPRISLEEVVRVQPEVLVFASSHSEDVKRTLDELRDRPGWRVLDAVKKGSVAIISDAINRPSPRLVDAVEDLAKQLHPEAFREEKLENRQPVPPADSFLFSNFYFCFSKRAR